jgi:hypothetical protein
LLSTLSATADFSTLTGASSIFLALIGAASSFFLGLKDSSSFLRTTGYAGSDGFFTSSISLVSATSFLGCLEKESNFWLFDWGLSKCLISGASPYYCLGSWASEGILA